MKKRNIACLALAAPLFALTACTGGTSSLALSANWFLNTGNTPISSANETLEYAVTFTAAEGNDFLSYGEGSYTTRLTAETIKLADETLETGYHLHTELRIPVTYTVNGETESFEDTVTSDAYFRDVQYSLQPVRSVKTVLSHSPFSETPSTLEDAYRAYEYTYTTEYDAACANAQIKIVYTQPSEQTISESVELTGSGTYLDNEQIIFAMRGVSMSSAAVFRSVNPVRRTVENVAMAEAPAASTEKMTFTMNGESAERELTMYTFSLEYSSTNPGQPQSYTYAGVTDANNNTYRCALLRMETPVLYSLGTLRYTLTNAQFGA